MCGHIMYCTCLCMPMSLLMCQGGRNSKPTVYIRLVELQCARISLAIVYSLASHTSQFLANSYGKENSSAQTTANGRLYSLTSHSSECRTYRLINYTDVDLY